MQLEEFRVGKFYFIILTISNLFKGIIFFHCILLSSIIMLLAFNDSSGLIVAIIKSLILTILIFFKVLMLYKILKLIEKKQKFSLKLLFLISIDSIGAIILMFFIDYLLVHGIILSIWLIYALILAVHQYRAAKKMSLNNIITNFMQVNEDLNLNSKNKDVVSEQ